MKITILKVKYGYRVSAMIPGRGEWYREFRTKAEALDYAPIVQAHPVEMGVGGDSRFRGLDIISGKGVIINGAFPPVWAGAGAYAADLNQLGNTFAWDRKPR